jgi:hypothetical protein
MPLSDQIARLLSKIATPEHARGPEKAAVVVEHNTPPAVGLEAAQPSVETFDPEQTPQQHADPTVGDTGETKALTAERPGRPDQTMASQMEIPVEASAERPTVAPTDSSETPETRRADRVPTHAAETLGAAQVAQPLGPEHTRGSAPAAPPDRAIRSVSNRGTDDRLTTPGVESHPEPVIPTVIVTADGDAGASSPEESDRIAPTRVERSDLNPVHGTNATSTGPIGGTTTQEPVADLVPQNTLRRVEQAIRSLENAPPPRSITVTVDDAGLHRVTVSLVADGVQLSVPDGASTDSGLVRALERTLESRGFDMSGNGGRQRGQQNRDDAETFRPRNLGRSADKPASTTRDNGRDEVRI